MSSYSFNGAKSAKFSLEVLLVGIIAQPGNNQGFEGIATDVGIVLRLVCHRN